MAFSVHSQKIPDSDILAVSMMLADTCGLFPQNERTAARLHVMLGPRGLERAPSSMRCTHTCLLESWQPGPRLCRLAPRPRMPPGPDFVR